VICPGGAYAVLAYDHEGIQVAKWFAARGVTAAILKYRLPHSDIMSDKAVGPLQDAQEAIRHLRRRAAELHLDPTRIGIMGFSAGGHLAASASTRHAEAVYTPSDTTSARPDFSILCYAVISLQEGLAHKGSAENLLGPTPYKQELDRASNELRVDASTPPAFLVHSQDDKAVPVQNSIQYYLALTRQGVAGELHLHEKGGHGYGLGVNPGSPAHWTKDLEAWLQRHNWASEATQ
jgi:acetyl esterase/lipase